jgi:hypothetical protein
MLEDPEKVRAESAPQHVDSAALVVSQCRPWWCHRSLPSPVKTAHGSVRSVGGGGGGGPSQASGS